MRIIEKFLCDKCSREYYESISAEKCELMHKSGHVFGSYLTHLAQVAPSIQVAVDHVVNCDWCKDYINTVEVLEKRDMALQRTTNSLRRE